jgi:hypothetical protein
VVEFLNAFGCECNDPLVLSLRDGDAWACVEGAVRTRSSVLARP